LIQQFKQRVIPVSLADVFNSACILPDTDACVQAVVKDLELKADVSSVNMDSLIKIAKLECTLRKFAEEKQITCMGLQCWTAIQEVFGVCPCTAMGRLTEKGLMAACEVDIYGALTMLIQYLASLKITPPHFIDWTIQHQEKENVFLAWHCGNAPPSLASEKCPPILTSHSILIRTLRPDIVEGTLEFQLKHGPVTICRLQEYNGKFKMLVTKGKIVQSSQKLRGSWSWVEVTNLQLLYRVLVEEGFPHHASMIHGDYTEAITDACKFLGIEVITVS
jgi:L-fucose isomerase-like protein